MSYDPRFDVGPVPVGSLPVATSSSEGIVQPDTTNLAIAGGVLSAINRDHVAAATMPGIVRPDGMTLDLSLDGTVGVHGALVVPITPALATDNTAASGNFCAYPALATSPTTKRLFLSFMDGFGDGVAGGRACVISTDNPLDPSPTWSGRVYPFGSPPSGWLNVAGGIVALASGRLVLSIGQADAATSPADNTAWHTTSDDHGLTWATPAQFGGGFTAWNYPAQSGIVHSSGIICLPVYGQDSGDPADNAHNRAGLFRSRDDGTSWFFVRISVTDNNLNECSIVELSNGHLRAYLRHDTGTSSMYIFTSESADAGLTWTTPVASSFVAFPGHPGALRVPGSDTILLWYRSTPDEHAVWRYSTDLGSTWSAEQLYSTTTYAYGNWCSYGINQVLGAVALETSGSVAQVNVASARAGHAVQLPAAQGTFLAIKPGTSSPPVALQSSDGQRFVYFRR